MKSYENIHDTVDIISRFIRAQARLDSSGCCLRYDQRIGQTAMVTPAEPGAYLA
ncbi:hypothetical protein [Nitrosococcus wardiae]|uniref:hypothetical protein n=1 Tax=Nitrosococcus wardiae TaxID=1814290 RepID=UPI00141B296A|nr:hypothetical protein [Nitrosococcus wardiae]